MPTKPYHPYLIESLKDPEEAAAYLDVVLAEGDPEQILLALKNLAEARREFGSEIISYSQGKSGGLRK
jgi:DNA-binding phage protein